MRLRPLDIGAEAVEDVGGATPEQRLAAAILQLALDDLQGGARAHSGDDDLDILREARKFCLGEDDPSWRRSREDWCDAAGIDPAFFQRQAAERCR